MVFWRIELTWRGFAFENVCFNHIGSIKRALGISGVATKQSVWSKCNEKAEGMQIDLLIERNDNIINMCEIKFYSDKFMVDKAYDLTLRKRRTTLQEFIPKKCAIHSTLITTFGLKENEYMCKVSFGYDRQVKSFLCSFSIDNSC